MRAYHEKFDWQILGILTAMFIIAFIFWNSLLIYPIKLFVVILHELSHGLAAVLTGGEIVKIEISEQIGGVCWTRGGSRLIVAGAGYLGSIVWGGVILIIAARTKYDNILGIVIGGLLILVSLLYIRNLFGFLFTLGFGVFLLVISYAAQNKIVDILMKFLGMTSCLYVIIDIKSDLIDRSNIGSDADTIAQLLGSQSLSMPIGFLWIAIAAVAFGLFLWLAGRGEESVE
ncbi:MAG: M50 family metallopeptidase [bacterium]|nr:M50 family metallopeptidase [bacterium]